jgi:hypothetical protein
MFVYGPFMRYLMVIWFVFKKEIKLLNKSAKLGGSFFIRIFDFFLFDFLAGFAGLFNFFKSLTF